MEESTKALKNRSAKNVRKKISILMPVIMTLFAIICDYAFEDLNRLKKIEHPYFIYFMVIVGVGFGISGVASLLFSGYGEKYIPKIKFYSVMLLAANAANLITAKTDWLPVIYFPSWDNILQTYIQYSEILTECVVASSKLYLFGILYGGIAGIVLGTAIGWSKRANYWIFPIIRFIGPIPTSVWVPFEIFVFPTLGGASEFIIGLSMAFPIVVLTSSGIQNIPKGYFEAGSILGADTLYQIIHIALPAALPQIFVGVFNGVTMAFMSLMVAELIGVQAGIGWYINWQQKVMSFPDVYAALILLAFMCFIVMKVLFGFRKKFLGWQEGAIRW